MSDKLFDSFIQEKMQQHVSQVPGDMWQRIVNEKERRDKAFAYRKWYAVAALLFLMLGSTATYFYFTSKGTSEGKEITEQPASKNNNSNNNDQQNTTTVTDKTEDNKQDDSSIPDEKNSNVVTAEQSSETRNNISGTVVKKSFRFDKEKPNAVYTLNNKTIITDPSVIKPNTVTEEESYNESKHYSLGQIILRENVANTGTLANYLNSLKGKGIPITACPSEKGDRNQAFYIEAYVSPDYNWKQTTAANTTFLNSKDSAEKTMASFTAGIRFAKPIGNHVMLKAGIQYSQINEKFSVRKENERRTVTVITTRTIQTAPGVFTTFSDTSSVEQIGYSTKTSINKYKNIDVPVLLSYEWGNEDIRFAVTGGSIINVNSSSKGQTLDSSGATVAYDKSNNIYKTNMGVGVYGSVSIIKPVGEKTEIFAEPYMRYNLSNMTKDGSGFTQKFNSAGINLGVRINIGRQRY